MKIFFVFLLLTLSINCFSMEPKSAYEMVQKGEAVLIDVREMGELNEGMVDKAMWFPKSQMTPGSDVLTDFKKVTKDKKVFVYCQGGKRAEVCKDILRKEGVDAESLGGFNELKKILPIKSLYQRVNEPYKDTEAFNRKAQ